MFSRIVTLRSFVDTRARELSQRIDRYVFPNMVLTLFHVYMMSVTNNNCVRVLFLKTNIQPTMPRISNTELHEYLSF